MAGVFRRVHGYPVVVLRESARSLLICIAIEIAALCLRPHKSMTNNFRIHASADVGARILPFPHAVPFRLSGTDPIEKHLAQLVLVLMRAEHNLSGGMRCRRS